MMYCPSCGARNDETNITCVFQGCRRPLPPAESLEANLRILAREVVRAVGQRNPRGLFRLVEDPHNPVTQAAISVLVWILSRGLLVSAIAGLVGPIAAELIGGPLGLLIPAFLFAVYRRYEPVIRQQLNLNHADKYCPQCGRGAPVAYAYCRSCGTRLVDPAPPASKT